MNEPKPLPPFVRESDRWFRCVVCHGSGVSPGEAPKFRRPCGHCNGQGYTKPEPYNPTNTYHMR